jgi:uncharacterized membrane protein YfcA
MLRISFLGANPQCYVIRRQIAESAIVFFRRAGYRCQDKARQIYACEPSASGHLSDFRTEIHSGFKGDGFGESAHSPDTNGYLRGLCQRSSGLIVTLLLISLAAIASLFLAFLLRVAIMRGQWRPRAEAIALGAVTNFFDTLGIGSFAPTTAWLKLRKLIPDSFIPATLNTGHALPTVCQALIFIKLVEVDPVLMLACIAAAVAGATLGVPLVQRLSVRAVQAVVGAALLIAALLYAMTNTNMIPSGGSELTLHGWVFGLAIALHFLLGALMAFGIGLYAPSLILLSLMGLNPTAAFPIMMGACAFLMPISATRFVRSERIDLRIVVSLAIGGIPAVLVAAYVVKSLPLDALRWGIVVVVLYAAVVLLRSALTPSEQSAPARLGAL